MNRREQVRKSIRDASDYLHNSRHWDQDYRMNSDQTVMDDLLDEIESHYAALAASHAKLLEITKRLKLCGPLSGLAEIEDSIEAAERLVS